ncbi:MAG: hypothetical protein R3E79_16295 [Caldilineaceae bacterium]
MKEQTAKAVGEGEMFGATGHIVHGVALGAQLAVGIAQRIL